MYALSLMPEPVNGPDTVTSFVPVALAPVTQTALVGLRQCD